MISSSLLFANEYKIWRKKNRRKNNQSKNCMAFFQNCLLLVPAPHHLQTIQRLNFNIALNDFSLINGSWFIVLFFHIAAVPVTNVGVAITSPNTVFYQKNNGVFFAPIFVSFAVSQFSAFGALLKQNLLKWSTFAICSHWMAF